MIRRLFTLVSVLSLVLCAAACVSWVRSDTLDDGAVACRIRREHDGAATAVWLEVRSRGQLWLRASSARVGRPGAGVKWDWYYDQADARAGRWGFESFQGRLDAGWGDPVFRGTRWGPLRWGSWTQHEPAVPFVQRTVAVGASHWLVALLLAILPVAWLVLRRRRRRPYAAGLCPHCGYDLRASPGRCPECGAAAAPALATAVTRGVEERVAAARPGGTA
jgi:hypothetical protein